MYISFSLNEHVKTKNGYFIKIVQNNLDEREIKFHVFDTFLRLMPVKSESLKISLQTNISFIYVY